MKAGFHEVIHNDVVENQKQQAIRENRSLWRVASTLFCHVQGDMSVRPLPEFRSEEVEKTYPDLTGEQFILSQLGTYLVDK